MNAPEPRIRIAFSAASPVAVILRRGPSKWYHVLKWNTTTDSIEPGAWLHGRIYAEKCGLSPDGHQFYYFATRFVRHGVRNPGYSDIWSAVSRPPWLTALAYWPADETWGGEGDFSSDRHLMISRAHWLEPLVHHPNHVPRGLVVSERLIGNGAPLQNLPDMPTSPAWFDVANGLGVDFCGRSFRVREGQLWRETDRGEDRAVCDFRSMRPARKKSPDWAREW